MSTTKLTNTQLTITGTVGEASLQNGIVELWRYDPNSTNAGPYIDFKTWHAEDYDARIQCVANSNGTTGRGGLIFRVGGTGAIVSAMDILPSGQVRFYNRPAFDVASTAGGSGYVNMNVSYINNGSHFNFSTDRFTAPVSGTYRFYASAIKATGSNGSVSRVYIRVNGTNLYDSRHLRLTEGANYGTSSTVQASIYLNAGDYAQYYVDTYGVHAYAGYTYWGGYLVS
jgi:hypothetical protein